MAKQTKGAAGKNTGAEKPKNDNPAADNQQASAKDNVFAAHPKLDVYYKTSDGAAFFTPNAAENHAKTLENKKVTKVTK